MRDMPGSDLSQCLTMWAEEAPEHCLTCLPPAMLIRLRHSLSCERILASRVAASRTITVKLRC